MADPSPTATPARTPSGYTAIWDLFTDWCAVTGHQALPAKPETVTLFLTDCPSAPATLRRRVAAIDHHHQVAGHPRPGTSSRVRAALGRPTGEPTGPSPDTVAAVETALRTLPSHGWTHGIFGRRDRCLLVLSQLVGVPYRHLATMTAGDVTLLDGTATIRSEAGTWTVDSGDDALVCGSCAVTRWLRVLDMVMTKPSHRVIARQIKDADPVNDQSPHLCRSARRLSPLIDEVPLLPPIDQWGFLPFPPQRQTPHSQSRLVRQMLAGDFVAHRSIAIDDEQLPEPADLPAAAPARVVYTKMDADRAWAKRRADLDDIAGIDDVLDQIDARAKELESRTAAVLSQSTGSLEQRNP